MTTQHVLERYGLRDATIETLPGSENTNLAVTASSGSRYLLRQHRREGHGIAALESEAAWLEHLHSRGVRVQRPVPFATGRFVLEHEGEHYSLLTWLDGEILEAVSAEQARRVGGLMARLHGIAREFVPPPGFSRPRYDASHLERTLQELRAIERLRLDWPLFERATTSARTAFLERSPWSLIHADLHPGNLVWQGDEPAVIDFDRMGFGPTGFDIATTFGYLETPERDAFLAGYEAVQPLPDGFEGERSRFTMAEWLGNLAFLAGREEDREYVDTVMLPGLREELPKMLG